MSFGAWIVQFLGVTSGWAGVTITKFFSAILLDHQISVGREYRVVAADRFSAIDYLVTVLVEA